MYIERVKVPIKITKVQVFLRMAHASVLLFFWPIMQFLTTFPAYEGNLRMEGGWLFFAGMVFWLGIGKMIDILLTIRAAEKGEMETDWRFHRGKKQDVI
jgi:hypothetical protein